jgi:hypothetical protein
MEVRKYERYGNDCIIYITLILDDDVLVVIERFAGCWGNELPCVTVNTENAKEEFEELIRKYEDKGENKC